jgi:hypothetical protein
VTYDNLKIRLGRDGIKKDRGVRRDLLVLLVVVAILPMNAIEFQ